MTVGEQYVSTLKRLDALIQKLESVYVPATSGQDQGKKKKKNNDNNDNNAKKSDQKGEQGKKQKQKQKQQPNSAKKKGGAAAPSDPMELFKIAKLQVSQLGQVVHVPDSEKLFMTDVDIGGGVSKKLVTGLAKHYSAQELSGKKVATIVNLKSAKLAGQLSEVMLLAGDQTVDDVLDIKILQVPENSQVGDVLHVEGDTLPDTFPEQISKKNW